MNFISEFVLPEEYCEDVSERARAKAIRHGVTDAEWENWRRGLEVGRDLLMALDPERESARIKEAREC